MKYFLDTNIFLRTLNPTDSPKAHKECLKFVSLIEDNKIKAITSNLVLSEVVWTLKRFYKFPKERIINAMYSIYNLKIPFNNNFQTQVAIEMFQMNSVKFIDAQIASIPEIKDKKWTVVSYDKDFDKLKVKRKEPGEIY